MNALARSRRLFLLPTTEEPSAVYSEIFAVEDLDAAKQAFEMARLFHGAVSADGTFDLAKAVDLVREDPELSLAATLDIRLRQGDDLVERIVSRVTRAFDDFLKLSLPPTLEGQLSAAITHAFVNLESQRKDAWIFYQQETGHTTVYQYNLLFAVQSAATGRFLYGVPMGLTVEVDLEYERVLFLTLKDEASYSVRVAALKAVAPLWNALLPAALRQLVPGRLDAGAGSL